MRIALCFTLLAGLAFPADEKNDPAPDEVVVEIAKDMALSDFLRLIEKSTGKAVLYDPNGQRIRNQTMGSELRLRVPQDKLLDAFRSILTFYEITLVEVGPKGYETYLAIDSRSTNNIVKNKAVFVEAEEVSAWAGRDGVYVSTFLPVKHVENLTTLRTALSTMVSPAGIGRVFEVPGNGVLVMDYAPTVAAMRELIHRLDVQGGDAIVLESIELTYASAAEVADALQDLYALPAGKPPVARGQRGAPVEDPRFVPFRSRNAVLVKAARRDIEPIRELVRTLDVAKGQRTAQTIVRLQHVDAKYLAHVLLATLGGPTGADLPIRIVAESHTQSLLLKGDMNAIEAAKAMIARIDVEKPAAASENSK